MGPLRRDDSACPPDLVLSATAGAVALKSCFLVLAPGVQASGFPSWREGRWFFAALPTFHRLGACPRLRGGAPAIAPRKERREQDPGASRHEQGAACACRSLEVRSAAAEGSCDGVRARARGSRAWQRRDPAVGRAGNGGRGCGGAGTRSLKMRAAGQLGGTGLPLCRAGGLGKYGSARIVRGSERPRCF